MHRPLASILILFLFVQAQLPAPILALPHENGVLGAQSAKQTPASGAPVNAIGDTGSGVSYTIKYKSNPQDILTNTALRHYYLAQRYIRRFDFPLAEVELQQAVIYMPDMKVAHRDLCLVSLAELKPLRVLAELLMVIGLYEQNPATPFEKTELDAKAAKLHYAKALSYGESNRWPAAIAELKRAQTYAPQNLAIERSLAFAYASNNQLDVAEKLYESSFADNSSEDAYYHADFAYLLSKQGKQDSAIEQLNKAIKLKPNAAALYVDLAWFYENKGDMAKAADELDEAVRLSPGHANLWLRLGQLWEKSGQKDKAKEAYAKAAKLKEATSPALNPQVVRTQRWSF